MRNGLTLIEVAVTILVLAVGLAASLSLTLTGVRWGEELGTATMAIEAAHAAIDDPAVMLEEDDDRLDDLTPATSPLSGWVGNYFVVRLASPMEVVEDGTTDTLVRADQTDCSGYFLDVDVRVYQNVLGDDPATGDEILHLLAKRHFPVFEEDD